MNYTSIDQSKHLLELGLKPETVDIFIPYYRDEDYAEHRPYFREHVTEPDEGDLPCWSTDALLELIPKHPKFNTVFRFLERQIDGSYKYIWIFECHAVSEYTFEGTSDFDCIYQVIVWLLQNNYIKTE